MHKIILYIPNKYHLEFFKEYISHAFGVEIIGFSEERETLSYFQAQIKESLHFFYEHDLKLAPLKKWIKDHPEIFVTKVPSIDFWMSSLRESLKDQFRLTDGDFIHVNVSQIQDFKASPCAIYLKLGPANFVCIIKEGEVYGREILKKYIDKEINKYFVHKDDLRKYLDYNGQTVLNEIRSRKKTDEVLSGIHVAALDHVVLSLRKFGINDYNMELMSKGVQGVLELTKKQNTLWKRIESIINQGSFLSIHSIGIAFLSVGISQFVNWNSEMTRKKLVLASFFHDISLEENKLIFLNSNVSDLTKYLTPKEISTYNEHPKKSLLVLSRMIDIPANVDDIILEHHERPDGSGFPKKLDYKTIAPLSACFIVAEELFHLLGERNFDYSQKEDILLELSQSFNKGQFVELLEAVKKLLV